MALVTEDRIDELLRESLEQHGVSHAVKEVELVPTPSGVLAEVVLVDASVLERAQRAVQELQQRLEGEGISLLATVRAVWEVENVGRVGIAYPSDTPSDTVGALFRAGLKSGARLQEVWVSVTPSAQQILRPLATNDTSWLNLIRAFLEHWLAIGGAAYWDPLRQQKLEVGESAARYLRWRPYEQLRGSVDEVFRSVYSVRRFLQQLADLGKRARDTNDVLGELRGPGGAFARGERVPRSNYELYEMLLPSEKDQLSEYYLQKLGRACKDWPALNNEFSIVLAT